jgi:hypothetical protein
VSAASDPDAQELSSKQMMGEGYANQNPDGIEEIEEE